MKANINGNEERKRVIALRGIIMTGVEEILNASSAKSVKVKSQTLLPIVAELGQYVEIYDSYNAFEHTIGKELEWAIGYEDELTLDKSNKEKKKAYLKHLKEVVNQIALDIRSLGFADEELEVEQMENMPGYNKVGQQIIGLLAEIQSSGAAPKIYAIVKQIAGLIEKLDNNKDKLKSGIQSIMKNEMRDYYQSKHENKRKILIERLNQVIMPNI